MSAVGSNELVDSYTTRVTDCVCDTCAFIRVVALLLMTLERFVLFRSFLGATGERTHRAQHQDPGARAGRHDQEPPESVRHGRGETKPGGQARLAEVRPFNESAFGLHVL